jgi:hypothetical protein
MPNDDHLDGILLSAKHREVSRRRREAQASAPKRALCGDCDDPITPHYAGQRLCTPCDSRAKGRA